MRKEQKKEIGIKIGVVIFAIVAIFSSAAFAHENSDEVQSINEATIESKNAEESVEIYQNDITNDSNDIIFAGDTDGDIDEIEDETEIETTQWYLREYTSDATLWNETAYATEPTQEEIDAVIAEWENNGFYLTYTDYSDAPSTNLYFDLVSNQETETVDLTSMDVWQLGEYLYGIPEWQTTRALKLISYEGYGYYSSTLNKLCADTVVSRLISEPNTSNIFSWWGGADPQYNTWMDSLGYDNYAIEGLYNAYLNHVDVWSCNGMETPSSYYYAEWCNGYMIYVY